ncbi:ATP-binding protein [Moraxella oblonga]|uniref:ATP-binding protein n=1 Tax=Moraxella oblonga TaxID=200413 RepID=UPI000ACC3A68|nr:ATP-binding protein [Moraxella oblonga]
MKSTFFDLRSAYGQLVLIVFLPIMSMALMGAYSVFSEVRQSVLSEQETIAVASLMRYEPMVRPLLHDIQMGRYSNQYIASQLASEPVKWLDNVKTHEGLLMSILGFKRQSHKEWLKRVVVTDKQGKILINTGLDVGWHEFDVNATTLTRLNTKNGTAYGMPIMTGGEQFWLFVDMDNQPLVITYYRVLLALMVTGLITMLLLLLILNIYSKRWIAPIYEMRLHLQKLSTNTLTHPLTIKDEGEFALLRRDFAEALGRLNDSFIELQTHAQETEADLQQAFDELEMQNISIRKTRDDAISASQAKTAFLANISHELRTPLNSIDGFIGLLARHEDLTPEQNLYVQTIKKSSAHLLALVNDVLDFSKMEAGKLVLDTHEFDLYAVIYDVVDMLSPSALEKHLRLCVLFYNDVPTHVVGDSLRIKQILTNLVGNAIKFTDTGSVVVKVMLSDDKDNFLHISVEDTGKGVSESDKAQLFKSFGQGDLSVTRRYGGTGLGLVISKQLVRLMGGQIGFFDNVSSNIAKSGATFWFDIPIHLPELNAPITTFEQPLAPVKILVWINHNSTRQVLQASLAQTKIEIYFAIGFADLLEQLDKPNHGFDWVIVDYFGQDASLDDVGAILRQIRTRYQGQLSAYGYQVGMDNALLAQYKTHPLYEPMDKRQLYAMLTNQHIPINDNQVQFTGKTVLAVDDHFPNLLVLKALLGEFGVEVLTANSGFDAIDIMSKAITGVGVAVDLIFMDIQMPRMSGLEASLEIRKIEQAHKASGVPIIALTAHGLSDEKDRLVASGMSDYVSKPIGLNQLAHTLQKWFGESNESKMTEVVIQVPKIDDKTKSYAKTDDVLADIDWADALERSANKPDLAKTLLSMMIDSSESEKLALERAWADRDRTSLADIAHRIVGASRYTGVPKLRTASETFEQKCRTNLSDTSAGQFIGMRPSYRTLIDALDSLENINLEAWLDDNAQ